MGSKASSVAAMALAVVAVTLAAGCTHRVTASPDEDCRFVGQAADASVFVVTSTEDRWVEIRTGSEHAREPYWDAAVLSDGSILLADASRGLIRRTPDGREVALLEPYQLAGSIFPDPSGRFVAYPYPLARDNASVRHVGIGLLDLATGLAELRLSSDDAHADLLGWHDGKMVFFWSHSPAVVRTLDLEGREDVLLPIAEDWWYYYPIEGPYLICYTPDGVAVIDLRTQERRIMIGATRPVWTKAGLQVTSEGRRQVVVEVGD